MYKKLKENVSLAITCLSIFYICILLLGKTPLATLVSDVIQEKAPRVNEIIPTALPIQLNEHINILKLSQTIESRLPPGWFVGILSADIDPRVYFYDPRNFTQYGDCEYGSCIIFDNKKYLDTKTERNNHTPWTDYSRVYGNSSIILFKETNNSTSEELLQTMSTQYPTSISTECGPGLFNEPMQIFNQIYYPAVSYKNYPLCDYENNFTAVATNTYFILIQPNILLKTRIIYNQNDNESLNAIKDFETALTSLKIVDSQDM